MSTASNVHPLAAVHMALADQFLDTETRHDVPLVALRCLEAGLTREQAREIWCYVITPAVGANLFSVAGEWAGWDAEWLNGRIARIERRRVVPGVPWLRAFFYWLGLPIHHRTWRAIDRCMADLAAVPETERRERARTLGGLARVYFDFAWKYDTELDRDRLATLYPQPFLALMQPLALASERATGEERVETLLAGRIAPDRLPGGAHAAGEEPE